MNEFINSIVIENYWLNSIDFHQAIQLLAWLSIKKKKDFLFCFPSSGIERKKVAMKRVRARKNNQKKKKPESFTWNMNMSHP